MAEITFTGHKTLKSINSEWCDKFPFLYLRFYNAENEAVGDWNNTHASIRAKKDAKELGTNAGMNVGTFEARYFDAFGVKVEIMFVKNGRSYQSLDDSNAMTLNEYNAHCATKGASKIKDTHPEWF